MLKGQENIKGISGYVDFHEKQLFLGNRTNRIVVYKYARQGLVGFYTQSNLVDVEDYGSFWVVSKSNNGGYRH